MSKLDAESTFQRLRNRYRLVVMNDDTYEEVVTFRLSRMSVYVVVCTVFVLLTGLTVALIVFTPLKLYIPGYQSVRTDRQYRELMYTVDSLKKNERQNAQYIEGLQKVLQGDVALKLDTVQLQMPNEELSND
jgi:cytochrome c-type biogenesis protein CcmH/NrfG